MELQNDIQRQVAEGKRKIGALVALVTAATKSQSSHLKIYLFLCIPSLRCHQGVNGACNDRKLLKDITFYFTGVFAEVNRTQNIHLLSKYLVQWDSVFHLEHKE